jgi:hypothetical protein
MITFSSEDGLCTNAEKCRIKVYTVITQKSLLMDGLRPLLDKINELFPLKEKLWVFCELGTGALDTFGLNPVFE